MIPFMAFVLARLRTRARLLLPMIDGASARWLPLQSAGLAPAGARLREQERDSRGLPPQRL